MGWGRLKPFLLGVGMLASSALRGAEGDDLWSFQTGGEIFGSPAMASDGTLYVGSRDNKVYALNSDGSLKWSFPGAGVSIVTDWFDSSPTVSEDESTIYAGCWDNYLYAIAAETGAMKWRFETGNLVVSSPAEDGAGNLFFGSSDGFFYSLDKGGQLRWSFYVGNELDSSPALDEDGNVFFGCYDGSVYSLSNDGDLRWEFATRVPADVSKQRVISPPTIGDEGEVYFGGGDGYLYALSNDGGKLWEYNAEEPVDAGVALTESGLLIFASRMGWVIALDEEGVMQWESYVGDVFYSTPAVDRAGRSYVGSYLGNGVSGVTALDEDGAVAFEYLLLEYVDSSPLIDRSGQLIFGAYDGAVYALEVDATLARSGWSRFGADAGNRGSRIAFSFPAPTQMFEEWRLGYGIVGPASDPCIDSDGDTLPLFLEYLFGTNPLVADGEQLASMALSGETVGAGIEFTRVKGDAELEFWVEYSFDGEKWEKVGDGEFAVKETVVSTNALGDGKYERVQLALPSDFDGTVLFRVRVPCPTNE